MRRPARLLLLPAFCLVVSAVAAFAIAPASAAGRRIFAVDATNNVVVFDQSSPGTISSSTAITGLQPAENVLGIDFRPATGQLFALGSTSRLYSIDIATGAATQVGTSGAFTLSGTSFGFDFNPTVDRVRVVSDAEQNLRLNPSTGTLASTDANLNPGNPNVVGAAYANNFAGATVTTLYDIDSASDMLNIQNPPNDGTLVAVGALGVDTSDAVGFDITPDNIAFASLTVGGMPGLYSINLTTGAATLIGTIGTGAIAIVDIAIELPAPAGIAYGVDGANNLITFPRATPALVTSTTPITGLGVAENVLGIDFRPLTGELFALGSLSRLYTIDVATGAATQVGTDGAFTLSGTSFGFDFNPTVDRLRVVSDTGQNIRLNPSTGTLSATDANINPGSPEVVGVGYTNNFPGATVTTLYDIDAETDTLQIQNPPNGGTLTPIGALGHDTTEAVGFDITATNEAFASLTVNRVSGFYAVDLTTGEATFIAPIGTGASIRDIALPPAMVTVDDAFIAARNTPLVTAVPGVRANDTGGTGTEVVTATTNGSVVLNADGSFTYTPNAGFVGIDTFTYRLTDGPVLSMVATVTITVTNAAPVAADDAYLAIAGSPLTIAAPGVLANDTDANSDALTAVLGVNVSNGTLALAADGSFTYTANAAFTGTDTFTYLADDANLQSAAATVTITVSAQATTTTTTTTSTTTTSTLGTTTTTAAVSPVGTLPVTGAPILSVTAWGLALTALGALVLAVRRRAAHPSRSR